MIRDARPSELDALTDLALRSKGHWGHPPDFLEACRAELTVGPSARVLERDGVVVGLHELGDGELDKLFVDPPSIGTGAGAELLADAVSLARARGWSTMRIVADPGAVPFYESRGAVVVGEEPSGSIPGRTLPVLELSLRS